MSEPSDRDFRVKVINMVQELVERAACVNRWRISAEVETIRESNGNVKNKNMMSQMTNSFDGLSRKLNTAEENNQ